MIAPVIALVSFLLLALQVMLMHALGHAQGHHLAYVVVSIALLGYGAAGSMLALWRHRTGRDLKVLLVPGLLLCALATALLPLALRPLLIRLEVDLLDADPRQWMRLAATGGAMLLPFFFGATVLFVSYASCPARIGRLYAASLLGSAAGAGGALGLLLLALPEKITPALAILPLLAAGLVSPPPRRGIHALTTLIVLAAVAITPKMPVSAYKALSYALRLPDARQDGPWPHPLGRVEVVTAPGQRYAPDLSLNFTGMVPAPPRLFRDGEGAGHLLDPADPAAAILAETPRGLPFALRNMNTVLCLAPGGTPLLNVAISHGARVTAVEPHPVIAKLAEPLLPPGRIQWHRSDPRLFLSRPDLPPLDLIVFPDRGVFGGPVGLQNLGEDTLFTVEAVRAAFRLLANEGYLAFSVWLDAPLRHAPRLLDLVAQALRAEGSVDPGKHLAIVRGWGSMSLAVGRTPLSSVALDNARTFAEQKNFDLIWPPGQGPRRHAGAGDELDAAMAALLGKRPEDFRAGYRFDIRAPVDDRPFFNQFLRLGEHGKDLQALSVAERAPVVLKALLALLGAAVGILVLLPLLPLRAGRAQAPFTLLYFAGIGTGFMCCEVALIQRMALLWGHPVTSVALVIAALMTGMGAGSALSRRVAAVPRLLAGWALAMAAMQWASGPALDRLIQGALGAPVWIRIGGGATLLALCAVPLGFPFPLGVRLLEARNPSQIPWACGIDGSFSVLAAPAAALLAYSAGFSSLGLASAAGYFLAALAPLSLLRRA